MITTTPVKIIKENNKFGVTHNGELAVPCEHETAKAAIDEWAYWEKLNTNSERKFLAHIIDIDRIDRIVKDVYDNFK